MFCWKKSCVSLIQTMVMGLKIKILTVFFIVLFILFIGLYWLSTGVALLGTLYLIFISNWKWVRALRKFYWLKTTLSIISIFALAVGLRVFVFEIYTIPTPSMENTLIRGDKVLVSKLAYGPKTPRSPVEIPWINILFLINKEARANIDAVWWNYYRLKGISTIKEGDVVVFTAPKRRQVTYIKRCLGLPGDTFEIKHGKVYTNHCLSRSTVDTKHRVLIWTEEREMIGRKLEHLNILSAKYARDSANFFFEANITRKQMQKVASLQSVDSVTLKPIYKGVFPRDSTYRWTINDFGPLVVPSKGMEISLDNDQYIFYKKILKRFEKVDILAKSNKFYLEGREVRSYTFRQNYYIMLGDNRSSSEDSRYWGFVPEEDIIAKAVCILFSHDERGFKWKRIMKLL